MRSVSQADDDATRERYFGPNPNVRRAGATMSADGVSHDAPRSPAFVLGEGRADAGR